MTQDHLILIHCLKIIRRRVDNLGGKFARENFTVDDFSGDCNIYMQRFGNTQESKNQL